MTDASLDVVAIGYVCAWMRWRSGSVWPAVVLHSVHNALLYPLFDMNTSPNGAGTAYAVGETGFAMAAVNIVFAGLVLIVVAAGVVVCVRAVRAGGLPTTETPDVPSKIFAPAGFVPTPAERDLQKQWDELIHAGKVRVPGAAHVHPDHAHREHTHPHSEDGAS